MELSMAAWVEMIVVLAVAGIAVRMGRRIGNGRWWWLGFAGALALVSLVIVGRRSVRMSFVWPVSEAVGPHAGPMLMALAIPMMLSVLMVKLREKRKRVTVGVLMGATILYFVVAPLALPLAVRANLLGGVTKVDGNGVCLQQHGYSCGPAAAVTCLRMLRVNGDEGAIGAAARTSPGMGTDGWMLAAAVNDLYRTKGVCCEYRFVGKLETLRLPAVASIWSPQYGGHYLAVLEVAKEIVVVGDPLSGRYRMGRAEFLQQWSGAAMEISNTR